MMLALIFCAWLAAFVAGALGLGRPLFTEPRLAVYDARDLMERLRAVTAAPRAPAAGREDAP